MLDPFWHHSRSGTGCQVPELETFPNWHHAKIRRLVPEIDDPVPELGSKLFCYSPSFETGRPVPEPGFQPENPNWHYTHLSTSSKRGRPDIGTHTSNRVAIV
jgi:hypothetical protein